MRPPPSPRGRANQGCVIRCRNLRQCFKLKGCILGAAAAAAAAVWSLFSKIPVWSMKHTSICLRLCHSPEEETSRGLGFGLIPLHTHLTTERLSLFVILSLGEFLAGADVGGKSHFPGQWKISIAYVNSISSNKPKKRISSLTTHHSLIHIPHGRYFPQYYYIDGWN